GRDRGHQERAGGRPPGARPDGGAAAGAERRGRGFLRSEDEKLQGLVTIIFYIFDIDRNSAHEDEITSVSLLQSCAFKVLGILCRLEALLAFTICKMQTKETLEKYLQLGMDLG
ncbi:unnamed protein product, partial [Heterosigma akashiwo]